MNKYTEIYGVDISKAVFDVYGSESGHDQFKNDEKGFKSFLKHLPKGALVVMEATGYYHYRLAQFLFKSNVLVSVVNPLSVKRFIQMKLAKVKTDKSDAKAICEYGQMNEVPASWMSRRVKIGRLRNPFFEETLLAPNLAFAILFANDGVFIEWCLMSTESCCICSSSIFTVGNHCVFSNSLTNAVSTAFFPIRIGGQLIPEITDLVIFSVTSNILNQFGIICKTRLPNSFHFRLINRRTMSIL